ncbi:MAG: tyrosine-type recombinase/integrase [Cyclobacteriaceae bacterium]
MIESFLKHLQFEKRLSRNTVLAYQTDLHQLHQFLKETVSHDNIAAADYTIIRSWIVTLVESGIEPASVNRKIACMRSFYKFLLAQEVITKNPMAKINVLKTKKRLPGFVKEEDMVNLLDNHDFDDNFEGRRTRLILEIFYGTGIRLSELIDLKDQSIDLKNRTIKVRGKRNKERVIPFSSGLVLVINNYLDARNREVEMKGHGIFFVRGNGEPCYPMMIYKVVKKYLSAFTSAEKRSPHVLRHTYATHLLNKGAELNAVKDLLGHTSLAATQVYTHNSMEKLKKAFEQAHPKA